MTTTKASNYAKAESVLQTTDTINYYQEASNTFLEECSLDKSWLEDKIIELKHTIHAKSKRPYTCWKYYLDLKQNDVIKLADGTVTKFLRSRFLNDRRFKKRIYSFYDSLGVRVKIYFNRYIEKHIIEFNWEHLRNPEGNSREYRKRWTKPQEEVLPEKEYRYDPRDFPPLV